MLAFCALFLMTLLGFCGFAVDLGNWYIHALRLQRAADAAALAGSIYLPNDVVAARSSAVASLRTNEAQGFPATIEQSSVHPTELEVSLSETVQSYFINLLGFDSLTITRGATAEYRPYVPMGSPSNTLGIEFNSADSWEKAATKGKQNLYWLNMSGPLTPKSTGDRYSSGQCDSSTSNCNASGNIPLKNLDYSTVGQIYVVRVPTDVSGTLVIQAFDPALTDVGDQCEKTTLNGANAFGTLYNGGATPQCTGDNIYDNAFPAPNTSFTLYTPELSSGGSTPVANPTCGRKTFNGYKGQVADKLNPAAPTYDAGFAGSFRKWSEVCRMYVDGSTDAGDYLLYVTANSGSGGLNRYALRVGIFTPVGILDTTKTAKIQLFSKGRLVVYARENTGNVTFYLARINSSAAGNTMTVTLFDIGDAAGGATLRLLPADDAKNNGNPMTAYSNCQYTPPGNSVYQPTSANCSISGITSGSYNGRIVNIKVDIPQNYTCNDADPNGCWTRLALTYGAGSVSDTTSWEVSLSGNPVRLLE